MVIRREDIQRIYLDNDRLFQSRRVSGWGKKEEIKS